MTPAGKILTSAAAAGLVALAVWHRQTIHLEELRAGILTAGEKARPAAAHLSAKSSVPPPRSERAAPSGRLLDRLDEKLRSLLSADHLASMSEAADEGTIGRMTLIAGLTSEEAGRLRRRYAEARLEKAKLQKSGKATPAAMAELDRVTDALVMEALGPERAARWQAAEASRRKADAEQKAAAAVGRVALTANLTPAQKDALYTAFLTKASGPQPDTDPTPRLRMSASIQGDDDLPPPDLKAEVKSVLTPEQCAVFDLHAKATAAVSNQSMAQLQTMIPAMIAALQELLEEPSTVDR